MAKKTNRFDFPRMETLIILVFLGSFLLWGMSKCNDRRTELRREATPPTVSVENPPDAATTITVADSATTVVVEPAPAPVVRGRLYVTIDGLNFRTQPDLNSEIIRKLKLFEEVSFLDEVTDSTYQINLGYEIADEPYVKIRLKTGQVGWVYGAGVNYYRKKRGGVAE